MRGSSPASSIGGGTDARRQSWFTRLASRTSYYTGRPLTFAIATLVILIWAVSGPVFHYSDTWQLVINTGTTIVTFLMVFLIQATQNRDAAAIQLKLDELLFAVEKARNAVIGIEERSEEEIEDKKAAMSDIGARAAGE